MTHNIKLDELAGIAKLGVRRAYVFLGLGTNLANDSKLHPYHLPGDNQIYLVPETVLEATHREYQVAFGEWIVGNGLRELIETFEVYLDNLYSVLMFIDTWQSIQKTGEMVNEVEQSKKYKKFLMKGVVAKLEKLTDEFGIETQFKDELDSIKRARNCLTHRSGRVGVEDCIRDKNGDFVENELIVKWHVIELFGYNEDGTEFIPPQDIIPMRFPAGSSVNMRLAKKSLTFKLCEQVVFKPHELREICFCFHLGIEETLKEFLQFAEKKGIKIQDAPAVKKAEAEDLLPTRPEGIPPEAKFFSVQLDFFPYQSKQD